MCALFHIMKLAGEAVDDVRKTLRREGANLFGGLWATRGHQWTRSEAPQELRSALSRTYPKLGRALALRDALQEVLAAPDLSPMQGWLGWSHRSRLDPFRQLARTLKEHRPGILGDIKTRLTNAAMEAVNGVLQMAKRMARGFRNFPYFRLPAYLKAGRLNIQTVPF